MGTGLFVTQVPTTRFAYISVCHRRLSLQIFSALIILAPLNSLLSLLVAKVGKLVARSVGIRYPSQRSAYNVRLPKELVLPRHKYRRTSFFMSLHPDDHAKQKK